jgi:hypothetical protein
MRLKQLQTFFAIVSTSGALLFSGCSGMKSSTDESASTPAIQDGKAAIYIYRDSSPKAGVSMDLWIDGQPLGRTAPTTHVYLEINPGRHTIVSKASNVDTLFLNAEPGKTYFVFQEASMGTYWATGKLQVVDERIGKPKVLQSWRINVPIDPNVDGHEGE